MAWTTKSSKIAYKTPHMTIRENEVLRPDGTPTIYSVLEAKPGAYLIGLDSSQNPIQICLVKQHRYTTDRPRWELPGGGIEHEEEALESAVREGVEEACIRALDPILLPGTTQSMNGTSTHLDYYVLATKLEILPFAPSLDEGISERGFFTIPEILQMLEGDQIADALSMAGLLRAFTHLELISSTAQSTDSDMRRS